MIKIDDYNEEDLSWLYSKTPEEERILNKMYEFERKYFSENSFNHLRKEFIKSKNKTHVYIIGFFDDLFGDQGLSFSKNEWKIKLVNTKESLYGWRGECDNTYNLIKIEESYKDDDRILLHEMIHAYEFMLEKYPSYHQFLLLELHKRLLPKLPNLDNIINYDLNIKNSVDHSPLFLLKSLDLDIQLVQPLGFIYGYGREHDFKIFNQYMVKSKIFNKYKSKRYQKLNNICSYATIEEANKFIKVLQQARLNDNNKENEEISKNSIPPLFHIEPYTPPIEYYIYKKDNKNKFTILLETIRVE